MEDDRKIELNICGFYFFNEFFFFFPISLRLSQLARESARKFCLIPGFYVDFSLKIARIPYDLRVNQLYYFSDLDYFSVLLCGFVRLARSGAKNCKTWCFLLQLSNG